MVGSSGVRIWAIAAVALALTGCVQTTRVLLPDIPLPADVIARAVEDPARWTRLTATEVVALARAQDGSFVGAHPVVRFLWLQEGPRQFHAETAPVWIVVSDDLPMPPLVGPVGPRPPNVVRSGLTWTLLSAKGEALGSSSQSSPAAPPTLPPP